MREHLGWVLGLFLGCFFCASFGEKPSFAGVTDSGLKVGFSEVPFELPEGTPLGGYGTSGRRLPHLDLSLAHPSRLFKGALGTLDPVRAKSMVVMNGKQKLVFTSLDLVGVTSSFKRDLVEKLRDHHFRSEEIFVSATHTHSGPGALSHNLFWEAIALDFYQAQVYEAVLNAAVDSVIIAERAAVKAHLSQVSIEVPGLQHNRRDHPERVDRTAHLIWAKNDSGALLGTLVNFAIHGVALDDDNLWLSADVPGGIEAGLKQVMKGYNEHRSDSDPAVRPIAVFINSAEGDISPDYFGVEGIQQIGKIFANSVIGTADQGTPLPDQWSVTEKKIGLPIPGMNIRNCVRLFRSNKPNAGLRFFSKRAKLHLLAAFFPVATRISLLRWGGVDLLSWPGEPTTELGWQLRDVALAHGAKDAMILGLTNGHLAYFTAPDEYFDGGYESCFSLYGSEGGTGIIRKFSKLMER